MIWDAGRHILRSPDLSGPGPVGEPPIAGLAPAVATAVFAATGKVAPEGAHPFFVRRSTNAASSFGSTGFFKYSENPAAIA